MVLLIDNYDSFSYNLVQLIGEVTGGDIFVARNDEITLEQIEDMNPSHIILSPGPGRPSEAGICEELVMHFKGRVPMMGVCLGHQAICEAFGARISYAKRLMHGKQSTVKIDTGAPIFKGLKKEIKAARYHSLAADASTIPDDLRVIASVEDEGEIMAVRHRKFNIYGMQFHPESVLTPDGKIIAENFLSIKEG